MHHFEIMEQDNVSTDTTSDEAVQILFAMRLAVQLIKE